MGSQPSPSSRYDLDTIDCPGNIGEFAGVLNSARKITSSTQGDRAYVPSPRAHQRTSGTARILN